MTNESSIHVYCNSSSHRGHEFMVAGGLVLPPSHQADLVDKIGLLKENVGMKSKFRFSDYRGGRKKPAYEGLVDLFFESIENEQIHFHTMICSFNEFDHRRDGQGSPEKSVNKLYYQLFLHRICRFYGGSRAIYAFPDRGDDSKELVQFRDSLCAAAYKKYRTKPNCLRNISPQNSDNSPLIQMTDVIIGSIASLRNGHRQDSDKGRLAQYVLENAPHRCWTRDTPREQRKLTVWNFRIR